jgi:phosphotransferase system HPr (HPr) family protein
MVTSAKNISKEAIISNELGLHARSAAKIAQIVQKSKAAVWIKKDDDLADASSIVDILTLACEKGSKVTIIVENPADIDILDALITLIEDGFGE